MECPLCTSFAFLHFSGRHGEYFSCPTCSSVFLAPTDRPDRAAEKARYTQHHNDVNDVGYQRFVSPIVDHVRSNFTPAHSGLDFGCGTGPVISFMLEQNGYSLDKFDPFFCQDRSVFSNTYDFIVSCEVIEHFHHPEKEFRQLRTLLKDGGQLICMTDLYKKGTDFDTWHYKDDPTHVIFYREGTIDFIRDQFGFQSSEIDGRLIVLIA